MADTVIAASLQADDQISPKVKAIKQQLREAQLEVITLSEKFGSTSKEAAAAAKRASELKDAIGDARSLVDAFNPDTKFRAFGAAINTVTGGFSALTGAMSLLNIEGEDVQKTLVKVQSALAISQGVAQVQEGMQAFKNLGSVLINSLGKGGAIGVAIAGVTALGYAIYESMQSADSFKKTQDDLANAFDKNASRAGEEIAKVRMLYNATQDLSVSVSTRIKNAEELRKQYPLALKNLSDEDILAGKAAKAIRDLSNAIVQKYKAEAIGSVIGERFSEQIKAEEALTKKQKELIDQYQEFDAKGIKQRGFVTKETLRIAISSLDTEFSDLRKKFDKENEYLYNQLNKAKNASTIAGGGDTGSAVDKATKEKEIKAEYDFGKTKSEVDQYNRMQLANNALTMRRILLDGQGQMDDEELAAAQEQYYALRTANEEYNASIEAADALAFDNKMKMMGAVSSGLSSLSEIVGKETATGKVLAAAGATIDTYAAITATLKNAAKTPAGGIPGFAIAQAIATGIFGFVQVKKILSTQVPGKASGGGGGSLSVSAPLQAQLPQASTTRLDQGSLNQIGNATSRAFVVESDITNNQERIRRLNRAARLG